MDYLQHHGIKGQKWGVRRFQNYDGTRIKDSDSLKLRGDTRLYRISNQKESGSLKGTYASKARSDIRFYIISGKAGELGFKEYKKLMITEISSLDDVTVRKGQQVVKDIVDKIGDLGPDVYSPNDLSVKEAYSILDKSGFLDDSKSYQDRKKILDETPNSAEAQNVLSYAMNRYLHGTFMRKAYMDESLDEYVKRGYDAIVDPEDFIWTRKMPLIIANEGKFKRTKNGVIYNKSSDEFRDEERKAYKDKKKFRYYTNEDERHLRAFLKN